MAQKRNFETAPTTPGGLAAGEGASPSVSKSDDDDVSLVSEDPLAVMTAPLL
jgi:hypothetical protein